MGLSLLLFQVLLFQFFKFKFTLIFQYQSTETGGLGAHGLRVQKPVEGVSRGEQGHAPIQPPEMGDVRVQDPLLSLRLVTHYLARVKGYSYCLPFFFSVFVVVDVVLAGVGVVFIFSAVAMTFG